MLFIIVGVKTDNVGSLAVAEPLETLTSFGIPQFHLTIVTTGQELSTVV